MAMASLFFSTITKKIIVVGLVVIIALTIIPSRVSAATLGISASATRVTVGQTFTIRVAVNTQDKTINNAEATVRFPTDLIEVVSVSQGGSIFSLWVEPPAFSNGSGTISFNGGVPNPGFKGSGNIISAVVRAKKEGTATLNLTNGSVRENDGLGTNILTGQGRVSVTIAATEPEPEEPKEGEYFERVVITSPTHPDRNTWYKGTRAIFNWRSPRGATASQTIFDRSPNVVPSVIQRPAVSTRTVDDIQDGSWYLHTRFLVNNQWSPIYSYKIQVDNTPPSNVAAVFETNEEGRLVACLTAIDKASQLSHFTVQIDNETPMTVAASPPAETIALLPVLSPGPHSITILAFDKAGNSSSIVQTFDGPAAESVTITDYSQEINDNESIRITGVGPANTQIRISLVTKEGLTRYYYVQTSATGDFTFTSEPVISGLYTGRAEVEDGQGGIKLSSEAVNIRVKQSLATKSIETLSGLKQLLTPQNIIILLLALIAFVGWFKYLRLRKHLGRGAREKSSVKSLSAMLGKKLKK